MASTLDDAVLEPIIDRLDEIQHQTGLAIYDVFDNWLEFIVTSLARDDDTYQDHVSALTGRVGSEDATRDILEVYAEAFASLVDTMENTTVPGTDYPLELLGSIYEHYGVTSDAFGQHFTPQNLAVAKSKLLFPDANNIRDATPDDPLTIGDPACGSGRLPFHAVHRLREIAPETPAIVVGRDIDATCARMAVVNFALWSIPAFVIHGNSLTYETWNVWRVNPSHLQDASTLTGQGLVTELDPENTPVRTTSNENLTIDKTDRDSSTLVDDTAVDTDGTAGLTESVTLDAFTN